MICLWLLVDRPRLILNLVLVCLGLDAVLLATAARGTASYAIGAGVLLILVGIVYVLGFADDGERTTAKLVIYERLADGPATIEEICGAVEQECPGIAYPPHTVSLSIAVGLEREDIETLDQRDAQRGLLYRLADAPAPPLPSAIPLPRSAPNGEIIVPVEAALDFAPQARKRRHVYEPLRAPMEDTPEEST